MTNETVKDSGNWLLWALWLFLGMSVLQPSDDLFRSVYFAAILPLTLYLYWHKSEHMQHLRHSLVPGAVLLLFLIISLSWSSHGSESVGRYIRWFLETVIFFAAVAWWGYQVCSKELAFGRYLHLIALASALGSVGFYIYAGHYPARLEGMGLLGHPILGSSVLISLWALGLLDSKMYASRWLWLFVGSGIAVGAFVFLSQSRGPLLAFCGFLLCLMVLLLLQSRLSRYWSAALLAVLVAGGVAASETSLFESMIARGDSYRFEIWSTIIEHWRSFWLTGVGIATPFPSSEAGQAVRDATGQMIVHPHNIFISMWFFAGIPGLLLFVGFIVHLLTRLWRGAEGPARGVAISIVLVIMALCFTDTYRLISSPRPIWIIFWLPLGFLLGWSVACRSQPEAVRNSQIRHQGQS